MHSQEELERILKKKGIGPQGSKSVGAEDLDLVQRLLSDDEVSLTTKATFLTALLLLEPTENEAQFIEQLKTSYSSTLPQELHGFFDSEKVGPVQALINKAIQRHDLSSEEASNGMWAVLDDETPDFLKGAFLESQRLKRETRIENKAFYALMEKQVSPESVRTTSMLDICDSYDGCKRTIPLSLFTSVVLGASGLPSLLHGVDEVAPKLGLTPNQVLKAGKKEPLISLETAAAQLEDQDVGWAYVDQQIISPVLYGLKQMRREMVKRPFLATFEKLLRPVRNEGPRFMMTSYTHGHYKREVAELVNEIAMPARLLHIKGMEGSTMLPLSRETEGVLIKEGSYEEVVIHPAEFGFELTSAVGTEEVTASRTWNVGQAILKGEATNYSDRVLYQAAVALHFFKDLSKEEAVEVVKESIASGRALQHFDKGN